jgi:hypothetical protein
MRRAAERTATSDPVRLGQSLRVVQAALRLGIVDRAAIESAVDDAPPLPPDAPDVLRASGFPIPRAS